MACAKEDFSGEPFSDPAPSLPNHSDAESFLERNRALVAQLARRLLRRHSVGGAETASDLVQISLKDAFEAFETFRGRTPSEEEAFIRRIVVRNAHDLLRRRRARRKMGLAAGGSRGFFAGAERLAAQSKSPSSHVAAMEQNERLARVLAQLSADAQEILRLRHDERLSFVEIGRRLGIGESAARGRWVRALEQLKNIWRTTEL